jgi:hypothetical protein
LKSSSKKANTVASDILGASDTEILGLSLHYLSDDEKYSLKVNITCDAA